MSEDEKQKWISDRLRPKIREKGQKLSRVPEGMWTKCPSCGEILQSKNLVNNLSVCSSCEYHFRMKAIDRIEMLFDEFAETNQNLRSNDPINFYDKKSYKDRLKESFNKHNVHDSLISGIAKIEDQEISVGVFDFFVMGGSMGAVVGEKIALVFDDALENNRPAVLVIASGGARMQESIISLMQMSKTSMLIAKMRQKGLPYIAILTDPTTGGVAASFASTADIILAEPKSLIGFAGPRVIEQTIRQKLPEGFQRSEFLLSHGFIDKVVSRKDLKKTLQLILSFCEK